MESENEIVGPYIAIYDHLYQQVNFTNISFFNGLMNESLFSIFNS